MFPKSNEALELKGEEENLIAKKPRKWRNKDKFKKMLEGVKADDSFTSSEELNSEDRKFLQDKNKNSSFSLIFEEEEQICSKDQIET